MDLVEFLRARLEEDERVARRALEGDPVEAYGSEAACDHGLRWKPARVLIDIKAKREILERYAEHAAYDVPDDSYVHATGRIIGLGEALRLHALAWASHPDYRQEWAPEGVVPAPGS